MSTTIRDWQEHLNAILDGSHLTGRRGTGMTGLVLELADGLHEAGVPHGLAQHLVERAITPQPDDDCPEVRAAVAFWLAFRLGQNPVPLKIPDTLPEEL